MIELQPRVFPDRGIAYHYLLNKNGIGAELGVCRGENSVNLLHYAKPVKMYLVDLWDNNLPLGVDGDPNRFTYSDLKIFEDFNKSYKDIVEITFKKEIPIGQVKIVQKDCREWLDEMPNDMFDWIFIDTSHFYVETYETLEKSIRVVKSGGIIVGHDFKIVTSEWDVVSPFMHFIFQQKIKPVGFCGPEVSPSIFCRKI